MRKIIATLLIILLAFPTQIFATENYSSDYKKEVKHGLGIYAISDATGETYETDENKKMLGKIVNDYYAVAICINSNNDIVDIKIDHLLERCDFTIKKEKNDYKVLYNDASLSNKKFLSDKYKPKTDFAISDGTNIDILLLEEKILELKNFNDAMTYLNKDAYKMLPLLAALSSAYKNAMENEFVKEGLLGLYIYSMNNENPNTSTMSNINPDHSINRKFYAGSALVGKDNIINNVLTNEIDCNVNVTEDGSIQNRNQTISIEPKNKTMSNSEYTNITTETLVYKLKNDKEYCIGKACIDAKRNY